MRGDQPVEKMGQDSLERSVFAKNIATAILNWRSKESICMALHGPWGSGKTSIINMSMECLKDLTKDKLGSEKPIIIRFQPWIFSTQEHLVKTFLRQLKTVLGKNTLSEQAKAAAEHLGAYEKLLGVAGWVPVVGEYADKAKEFLSGAKSVAEAVGKHADEDLDGLKKLICEALAELPAPIVIIVDDVDRLTNQEIKQLFQLIKAVADFPNTVYILAFDHLLIDKSLEDIQAGSDTKFIEKIVQLDFEVPNPSHSSIAAYFWSEIKEIIGEPIFEEFEQKRWNEVKYGYLPYLFINLREVKRYLNMVDFKYPLVKGEVSTVDLLILEAIRMFASKLYEIIKTNQNRFVSDSANCRYGLYAKDEERKQWIKSLVDLLPEKRQEMIQGLLQQLFPEVDSVYSNTCWGDGFYDVWNNAQRVCLSPYFDYYFQASLPEGQVSERETDTLEQLLIDPTELSLALKNYLVDGRLEKVVLKLESRIEKRLTEERVKNYIISLSEVAENLQKKPRGFMEISVTWALRGPVVRLVKKISAMSRKEVIANAVLATEKSVWLPVSIIYRFWSEWDTEPGEEVILEENRVVTKDEAMELKQTGLFLIRKNKNTGQLINSCELLSILYIWKRWAGEDEVREWFKEVLRDKRKIPVLLAQCGGYTTSTTLGSSFSMSVFRIDPKSLEPFCDLETLKMECEALLASSPEWLNQPEKEVLEIFLKGFNRKSDEEW